MGPLVTEGAEKPASTTSIGKPAHSKSQGRQRMGRGPFPSDSEVIFCNNHSYQQGKLPNLSLSLKLVELSYLKF